MKNKKELISKLKVLVKDETKTVAEIAKELGISTNTLYTDLNFRKYIVRNKKFLPNKDNVIKDIQAGLSVPEVAIKYNLNIRTIYNAIRVKDFKNK